MIYYQKYQIIIFRINEPLLLLIIILLELKICSCRTCNLEWIIHSIVCTVPVGLALVVYLAGNAFNWYLLYFILILLYIQFLIKKITIIIAILISYQPLLFNKQTIYITNIINLLAFVSLYL